MRLPKILLPLLLLALLLPLARPAEAITYQRGARTYLTLLGSRLKFPIFTKEFIEGEGINTVGGVRELWLPDQRDTWGVRLTRERVRANGAGLGWSLGYWRGEFADEAFLYEREGPWQRIAEYREPTHTFLSLDLHGLFIPWESRRRALGLYALLSLVGDYEEYRLERYSTRLDDPEKIGLTRVDRSRLDTRFAFGFGARLYLSGRFSLWLEKRWIVGERFTTERNFGEGGFFEGSRQKTLYAPINSLGLALSL